MQDVSKGEGRTVLFVSHNMSAVKSLCKNGVLLENGMVKFIGTADQTVDRYLSGQSVDGIINREWTKENAPGTDEIKFLKSYVQYDGESLDTNTPVDIITEFWVEEDNFRCQINPHLYDAGGQCIFNISTPYKTLDRGLHKSIMHIPGKFLNNGSYYVDNMVVVRDLDFYTHKNAHAFEVIDARDDSFGRWIGAVRPTFIQMEIE